MIQLKVEGKVLVTQTLVFKVGIWDKYDWFIYLQCFLNAQWNVNGLKDTYKQTTTK